MAAARSIPKQVLVSECDTLERAIVAERLATREALAPHRPGGDMNPERDAYAWLGYFRHLHRLHARGTTAVGAAASAATASSPSATRAREEADAIALEALRGTPARVELPAVGDASGAPAADTEPRVVFVYPKSAETLLALTARDRVMAWLTERVARLHELGDAPDTDLLLRAHAELAYQLAVCAAIVCHPGPGSPFGETAARPEPPAWTRALSPLDQVRIIQAHLEVNSTRLVALSSLVAAQRGESDGARPSWGVFFAATGSELNVAPESLMRDRSLAAVLAQVYLTGATRQEAVERAKARAEQGAAQGATQGRDGAGGA